MLPPFSGEKWSTARATSPRHLAADGDHPVRPLARPPESGRLRPPSSAGEEGGPDRPPEGPPWPAYPPSPVSSASGRGLDGAGVPRPSGSALPEPVPGDVAPCRPPMAHGACLGPFRSAPKIPPFQVLRPVLLRHPPPGLAMRVNALTVPKPGGAFVAGLACLGECRSPPPRSPWPARARLSPSRFRGVGQVDDGVARLSCASGSPTNSTARSLSATRRDCGSAMPTSSRGEDHQAPG